MMGVWMRWSGVIVIGALIAGCASSGGTQSPAAKGGLVVDVREAGAKGDGATKDTGAFQGALDRVAKAGGGTVRVPAGRYLIGSIVVGSNTTLKFEEGAVLVGSPDKADYPVMQVRWEGRWREGHRALIFAQDAERVAVVGPGKIEGNVAGSGTSPAVPYLRNPRGPCIVEAIRCKDVLLEGFSVTYARMWTIHPTECEKVVARGLTIRSDRSKANGDGIDVDSCRDVLIEKCDIETGDDAIALKSGRGMEAVRIGKPTENVVIRDSRLGSSFAAIALGTEMSGGLRNIRVENCVLTPGSNGIYIKSRTGRGGFMENVVVRNVRNAGPKAFVRIELTNKGNQDSEPVQGEAGIPRVGNLSFENVEMEGGIVLEAVRIDPSRPVVGLKLKNVTGKATKGVVLANVRDVELGGLDYSVESGAKLRVAKDVTGKGMEGAEGYVPTPATTQAR